MNQVAKSPTQIEAMNVLIAVLSLETGFIGAWFTDSVVDSDAYKLNWSYSFDLKMLEDFAKLPEQLQTCLDDDTIFKFKLMMLADRVIEVQTSSCGDLFLINARLIENTVITANHTLALPTSRYIINRKLNALNLPANFRFLRELSIKVKNEIFLPLRNNIFLETCLTVPYPSLQSLGDYCLLHIFRFLPKKDIANLSLTCKSLRVISLSYLNRNKSKTS